MWRHLLLEISLAVALALRCCLRPTQNDKSAAESIMQVICKTKQKKRKRKRQRYTAKQLGSGLGLRLRLRLVRMSVQAGGMPGQAQAQAMLQPGQARPGRAGLALIGLGSKINSCIHDGGCEEAALHPWNHHRHQQQLQTTFACQRQHHKLLFCHMLPLSVALLISVPLFPSLPLSSPCLLFLLMMLFIMRKRERERDSGPSNFRI